MNEKDMRLSQLNFRQNEKPRKTKNPISSPAFPVMP